MLVAGLTIVALAATAASADAAVKMNVKGWTTQPAPSTSIDKKNKEKIKNCRTDGFNGRRLAFVFKGSGIGKNKEIGLTLGRVKDAPADFPYTWPVGRSQTHTQRYGVSFPGTLGPENIDGKWFGTVWLEDKIRARGEITVQCGST
jgi:hypothetical protein